MNYIDFALVLADDALLDQLGGAEPVKPTDELSMLLLSWRQDVDAEMIGELVAPRVAVGVVWRALKVLRRARRRSA